MAGSPASLAAAASSRPHDGEVVDAEFFRPAGDPVPRRLNYNTLLADHPDRTHALDSDDSRHRRVLLPPRSVLAGPAGYWRLLQQTERDDRLQGGGDRDHGPGIAAILSGNIWLMLAVLFLMGAQSRLFSPSKFGGIPEIVRPEFISKANGLRG